MKKIFLVLLVLVVGLSIVGCRSNNGLFDGYGPNCPVTFRTSYSRPWIPEEGEWVEGFDIIVYNKDKEEIPMEKLDVTISLTERTTSGVSLDEEEHLVIVSSDAEPGEVDIEVNIISETDNDLKGFFGFSIHPEDEKFYY